MSTLANRYAKALLDLAVSENKVEDYRTELAAVAGIYKKEEELSAFLLAPFHDLTAKKNVLSGVFKESVNGKILNFLLLLLDKRRIQYLPDISAAYGKMADEYRKVLAITVTTPLPLTQEQIDNIASKFMARYHGAHVKVTVRTDKSLIGGIRVAVGDKLYDGTVKGKLTEMCTALTGP